MPQADELVEAGRRHVARGQVRQAMACFRGAADDPEQGAEALSLLAAAYLLPGACAPELALVNAYRAARHPAADREHLTRCAMVALTAGDPAFADELASRAFGSGGEGAAAIVAIAKLRQDDRGGLRRLLGQVDTATGPWPYWRRLAVESAALGWVQESMTVRRLMRRGGQSAPGRAGLLVRALPPPVYLGSLMAMMLVALGGPDRMLADVGMTSLAALGGLAVWNDRSDGRMASAWTGFTWMVGTTAAWAMLWHL